MSSPVLRVETTRVTDLRALVFYAEPRHPLVWLRRGEGFVGYGEAMRLEFSGPNRFTDAAEAWRELAEVAEVRDEVELPGTGLIAFGSFAFDDASAATSVLIVPRFVVGKKGARAWVTRIGGDGDGRDDGDDDGDVPGSVAFGPDYRVPLTAGATTPQGYREAVAAAVERIRGDELGKVVLARDLVGRVPAGVDLRRVIAELALGYPDCWTFAVDGMLGASPETLVRSEGGRAFARVLAGTVPRGRDLQGDDEAAAALLHSRKDGGEHAFAVESVMATLGAHTDGLTKSDPFTLRLPNLWHLATDVEGVLRDASSALDLAGAMHPTAAVAGTPRDTALSLIRQLEPFDRARYAGPVGWIDAAGDGEWAIALRCAQVDDDDTIHAYAGCGIVADSDPDAELAESRIKFRPIVEAFA